VYRSLSNGWVVIRHGKFTSSRYDGTGRQDGTQAEAAEKLGITQSRVSDLVRGKWEKFNLEMLITLEGRLGRKASLKLVA
jgi:plasmid maintenance system antidote protein VapI